MNIDWNQAAQGYNDELNKTGGMMGDIGHKVVDGAKSLGNKVVDGAKSLGNKAVAGVTNLAQKPINYLKDQATDMYNNSTLGQMESGLGNLGNIASAVAPLGLAAMMGGMGGGKGGAGTGNTYNYNYGTQGKTNPLLAQSRSGVGSLSSTNTFDNVAGPMVAQASYEDKTAGLVDTVAGVVRNRAINDLIDKSVAAENPAASPEAAEKEVEITSKYPEMSKLLEDEQNKAYLQKLLKN